MRRSQEPQMKLGAAPIENIKFDLRSRDDIPSLLMGLQYVYINQELRDKVFL